jgi:hypothetical protein
VDGAAVWANAGGTPAAANTAASSPAAAIFQPMGVAASCNPLFGFIRSTIFTSSGF